MTGSEGTFEALLRLLQGDIQTLFELTFKHRTPVPEANIRASATILRRWLVDGDIKKLNSELTEPIMFPAFDTTPVVRQVTKTGTIDFFVTAGVRMNGCPVQGICHSPLHPSENDVIPLLPLNDTLLKLSDFLRQRRIYFRGDWFTLETIVRYVANKLGGNHYDSDRRGIYGGLDEVSRFMRYGGPADAKAGSELYLILEPDSAEVIDGVHLEILAAAASFVQMHLAGGPLVTLDVRRPRWFSRLRQRKKRVAFRLIDNANQLS